MCTFCLNEESLGCDDFDYTAIPTRRDLPLKPCFRGFPLAGPLTSPNVNKGSSFAGKEPILGLEV